MKLKVSSEYDKGQRFRTLYAKECKACAKEFWIPKNRLETAIACSPLCRASLRQMRGKYQCSGCAKFFERRKSSEKNSRSGLRFCSRFCKDKAQGIEGLPEIQAHHYKDGSRAYRQRAFRLYGQQCAYCGYAEYVKMLDVHHRDGNRKNAELDNLLVVCVWCHACLTRKVELHRFTGQ